MLKTPKSITGNVVNDSAALSESYVFAEGAGTATNSTGLTPVAQQQQVKSTGTMLAPIDEASGMDHDMHGSDMNTGGAAGAAGGVDGDSAEHMSPWRAHPATRRMFGATQRQAGASSLSHTSADPLMAELSSFRSPNTSTNSLAATGRHRLSSTLSSTSAHNTTQFHATSLMTSTAEKSAHDSTATTIHDKEKVAKYFTFADADNKSASSSAAPLNIDPNAPPLASSPSMSALHNACSSPTRQGPKLAKMGDNVPGLGDCVGFIKAGSERFSLGELGLLEKIPRTATLRAEEPVVLLRIDQDVFDKYIKVRHLSCICCSGLSVSGIV
jgi:hypothetical protein